MSQKFKNIELTRTKVKNNILAIWHQCDESDKFDWYKDANQFAKDYSFNDTVLHSKLMGIIAALSPLKTWEQNKKIAIDFLLMGTCGHMALNVNKAKRIIESDGTDESILNILNGNKISAFYLNIKYYNKATNVTIDRHALSIALGYKTSESDYSGMTLKQYEFFQDCYIWTANKLNISPLLLQSATWVKYRKLK